MIDKLSLRLAQSIKKVDQDRTPSVEVMKFSLYILIHTLITILIILVVSIVDGKTLATLYGLGYFMLLRQFSGGYHVESSMLCTVLSVVLIAVAPFVPLDDRYILALNVVNALMMLIFSPTNMKGYSRVPEKYYKVLKIVSLLIIGTNFMFSNATLAIVALFQSILLVIKQKGGEQT